MKDAVERIRKEKRSVLLLRLATNAKKCESRGVPAAQPERNVVKNGLNNGKCDVGVNEAKNSVYHVIDDNARTAERTKPVIVVEVANSMLNASVRVNTLNDMYIIDESVGEIVIGDNCCNEYSIQELDMSRFVCLKTFIVGTKSCRCIRGLQLANLALLEKVEIGSKSFVLQEGCNKLDKSSWNGCFCLKNCERLRELKIGCDSFTDYSACEIENLPSLEVIEMGELNKWSFNFCSASLELNSECDGM